MKNYKGNLLIEIGTEELPINGLKYIGKDFIKYISEFLNKYYFYYSKIDYFVSLRRISCLIYNLNYYQKLNCNYIKIYSPYILVDLFNYNILYKKILLWCKKNNFKKSRLKYDDIKNKRFFYIKKKIKKINISIFIKKFFIKILYKLQINHSFMKWGNDNLFFIRPVNNLCIVFNDKIIKIKLFNIKSNNIINGHKFILNNKNIIVNNSINYVNLLYNFGKVIIEYKKRREILLKKIKKVLLKKILFINFKRKIFNKIIYMTEWPVVLISKFDSKFLCLPNKLINLIIEKQYCLCTFNNNNKLTNNFIIIIDIKLKCYKNILLGYSRIINSKLNDSCFLFLNDRKKFLINYLPKLKKIIFHKTVGNFLIKIKRLLFLTNKISSKLNLNINLNILNDSVLLCKCDLATSLYKEFNKLKGFIGMYYLILDNKFNNNIPLIIKEHYYPRFINDKISKNIYSNIISLSDKLDTLIGISLIKDFYYLNKSNDPYGLRRLSLSIIRIILTNKFNLNLLNIIKYSLLLFELNNFYNIKNINLINNFIFKRCIVYFIKLGYKKILINSFIKIKLFDILDIKNRMDFIINFKYKNINDFKYIVYVNKRLKNIFNFNVINYKFIEINNFFLKDDLLLYKNFKKFSKYINVLILNKNYKFLFKIYLKLSFKINNFLNRNKIYLKKNINLTNIRISLLNNIFLLFLKFMDFTYFYN